MADTAQGTGNAATESAKTTLGLGQGGKKNAPAPADYASEAEKAAKANQQSNRPDQTNAFGSTVQWEQAPDGSWHQKQGFGGALGGLSQGLMGQAAGEMGQPFDWSQFGEIDDGSDARDQAISAYYDQATSRLNPEWAQREELAGSRLANSGLDPNSQAYRNAQRQLGNQRNDAYGGAMRSAIGAGQAAGDSVFRNSMMSRQQAISEALRKRGGALGDLGQLGQFLGQQNFMGVNGPDYLAAAMGQDAANMQQWDANNFTLGELFGGIGSAAGGVGDLFSGLFGNKKK